MLAKTNADHDLLTTIFANQAWRFSQPRGMYPNVLARLEHDDRIIGAVVVVRGHGQDFALGEAGLDRVVKAEQEGRITIGYVVLANEANIFTAAEVAQTVYDRLREYPLLDGKFGSYWWITDQFQPSSTMRQTRRFDPDAVF
jgi:hypothetical protein